MNKQLMDIFKKLTEISIYGTLISGMLFFCWMFIAFLFDYTITYLEPNKIVAFVELVWVLFVLVISLNILKTKLEDEEWQKTQN